MRRREDNEGSVSRPKSQFGPVLTAQKQKEIELGTLLELYATLPNSTRLEILTYLTTLSKEFPMHVRLQEIVSTNAFSSFSPTSSSATLFNFLKMASDLFDLRELSQKLLKMHSEEQKSTHVVPKQGRENTFAPINAIHPKYQIYYRMSQEFHQQGQEFNRQKPLDSEFYAPPRLFVRLQQRKHFKNGSQLKGNILLLTVDGTSIAGRNGLAITDRNNVQWWQNEDQSEITSVFQQQKPAQEKQRQSQPLSKQKDEETVRKIEFKFKLRGHNGRITSVSISNDELYMLTAGSDCIVKLWCLRSQMQLAEYKGHTKVVWSVDLCQSGYFFLTGSGDKYIKLWKTDQPSAIRILTGHQSDVFKVKFMPNPDLAISCGGDGTVRIWNIVKASALQVLKFKGAVYNLAVSFSGRYVSACDEFGSITVYDLVKGTKLNTFSVSDRKKRVEENENHNNAADLSQEKSLIIQDMSFSDNQREFACVSNRHVIIYSMDTISEKVAGNIFAIYGDKEEDANKNKLSPTELIYIGRDSSLFYCKYHPKNYLVVAGTNKKY